MSTKKLITPTEQCAAFIRTVVARARQHKEDAAESRKMAALAIQRGNYDDAIRFITDAKEESAAHIAAHGIAYQWRLLEPTHYIPPVAGGGLPPKGSKLHSPLCRSRGRKAVTCSAAMVTCPACVKLLLFQIDERALASSRRVITEG